MDLAKAFSFVMDDPEWIKKIFIGGLVSLIPLIGPLIAFGYVIAIGRNVIRGNPQPLPEWSDWGQMIVDGLYAFFITLIYSLPVILVLCLIMAPAIVISNASGDDEVAVNVSVSLAACCIIVFNLVYSIVVYGFLFPAALARYADTGDAMSALRFGEIFAIARANPAAFLIVLLINWVAGFLASFGVILCCVGVLFTTFYAWCVTGYAYGQAYLEANPPLTAELDY